VHRPVRSQPSEVGQLLGEFDEDALGAAYAAEPVGIGAALDVIDEPVPSPRRPNGDAQVLQAPDRQADTVAGASACRAVRTCLVFIVTQT
jgi:hypothetical protein